MKRSTLEDDNRHNIHKESWTTPKFLPNIDAREGYSQRWVRTKIRGEDDTGVGRMMTLGWRPRAADSIPKDIFVPKTNMGEYGNVIGTHDSILMEIPQEVFYQMQNYKRSKVDDLESSVKTVLQQKYKERNGFTEPKVVTNSRTTNIRRSI